MVGAFDFPVFLLKSANDLGTSMSDTASQDELYDQMIDVYTQIIDKVHQASIDIFGATINAGSRSLLRRIHRSV